VPQALFLICARDVSRGIDTITNAFTGIGFLVRGRAGI
jgi:hypothetical protein